MVVVVVLGWWLFWGGGCCGDGGCSGVVVVVVVVVLIKLNHNSVVVHQRCLGLRTKTTYISNGTHSVTGLHFDEMIDIIMVN